MNEPWQNRRALPDCDYWNLQRRAAEAIREVDPDATIVIESNEWDSPGAFEYLKALDIAIFSLNLDKSDSAKSFPSFWQFKM